MLGTTSPVRTDINAFLEETTIGLRLGLGRETKLCWSPAFNSEDESYACSGFGGLKQPIMSD